MKDMQTKIVMIGILLSTGIMLRAQDNGGCEDCPALIQEEKWKSVV